MITTGFSIGDRDWWLMAYLDVSSSRDIDKVYGALLASGCDDERAQDACMVLSQKNSGYTFTNYDEHSTIVVVSRATSAEQAFDSIVHELKHVSEHISEFYDLDPKEELAAYLQGEVGRKLFPAAAMVLCPRCSHD